MGRSTYEDDLQIAVAQYLDLRGWLWTHVANESKAKVQYRVKAKRKGLKAGVPDCLIFEPWEKHDQEQPRGYPTLIDEGFGVAIELKSPKQYPRPNQRVWLAALKKRGWSVHVCRTIDEHIK
jgi:hypothetical protein